MINILGAFLGVSLSLLGLLAFILGVFAFFVLPVVSTHVGDLHLWLGLRALKRTAITVSEHNEITLKSMKFLDIGAEKIKLHGEEKLFSDPDNALSTWKGFIFALADEESGTLFDPRHAAIGMRRREARRKDEITVPASDKEWEQYPVNGWIQGVFEMPDVHELVDLSAVRELKTWGERAEHPKRVEELFKNSLNPYQGNGDLLKLALPIIAFLGVFLGITLIKQQLGGGSSGHHTTISFGGIGILAPMLGLSLSVAQSGLDENTLLRVKQIAPFVVGVLIVIGLAILLNPVVAIVLAVDWLLGFGLPALIAYLAGGGGSGSILGLLLVFLTFQGYKSPVLEWRRDGYHLREEASLGEHSIFAQYRLFGKKLGFTYPPQPENFSEAKTPEEVTARAEIRLADSNLPPKMAPSSTGTRGGFGVYVPESLEAAAASWYLDATQAKSRLVSMANGDTSQKRLLWAKQNYGGGKLGLSDKTIAIFTFLAVLGGGILGYLANYL